MPLWVLACIIMTGIIILIIWTTCRAGGNAGRQMERMNTPRLTFADSDIQDTLDELLQNHPEIVNMKAEKGEAYYIKIATGTDKPGHEYIGYGPAVIVAVAEDENE